MMADKNRNIKKKWWLLIVLFLVIFFFKYLSNGFLFGYRTTFVLTGSMEPQIPIGSILLERKCEEEEALFVGDIITFLVDEGNDFYRVTHRIVKTDGVFFYTKGDANPEIDNWYITMDDVESKVIYIYPCTFQTIAVVVFILFNTVHWQKSRNFKIR